jgi:hypothetical protein
MFVDNVVHNYQLMSKKTGTKIYSLSDAYANARACTYFSTYE